MNDIYSTYHKNNNIYLFHTGCNRSCRRYQSDGSNKIDGNQDCPMCGLTLEQREQEGIVPGLDGSHVQIGFKDLLDHSMREFYFNYVLENLERKTAIQEVRMIFGKIHDNKVEHGLMAIQPSCRRCNSHLEKCTVKQVNEFKKLGHERWKEYIKKRPADDIGYTRNVFKKKPRHKYCTDEDMKTLLEEFYHKHCVKQPEEDESQEKSQAEVWKVKQSRVWNAFKDFVTFKGMEPKGRKFSDFLPFMESKGHVQETDNHRFVFLKRLKLERVDHLENM